MSLTREFDCPGFSLDQLRVPLEEIEAATLSAPAELMEALKMAAENVRLFHQHEMRGSWTAAMRHSQMLGQRMIPVDRAGLYVPRRRSRLSLNRADDRDSRPGGGCPRIFICTPPGNDGQVNQAVMAAAGLLGVTEMYRLGGAQAVAAMAFGTAAIRSSDVIVGPGNIFCYRSKAPGLRPGGDRQPGRSQRGCHHRQRFGAIGPDCH